MPAYYEDYLRDVRKRLGVMFYLGITVRDDYENFQDRFLKSHAAWGIENSIVTYLAGSSGTEWYMECLNEDGIAYDVEFFRNVDIFPDEAYWVGWSLAYYQWYRNVKFKEVLDVLNIDTLLRLYYHPYHEADITKFVSYVDDALGLKNKNENA